MSINIVAVHCEDDRYVWCLAQEDAYLYRLDRMHGVLEQIIPLLDEVYVRWAYSNIICYKNYLIIVPCNADAIVMVNRDNLEKEYIELPIVESYIGKSTFKFFTGIVYQDTLFLFGYAYPGIVKVDLVSKRITVKDLGLKSYGIILNNENDGCFHGQYVLMENVIYFPFMNTNAVLEFNMKVETSNIHVVGDDNARYISIEWADNCFWLIPRDGRNGAIVKWNLKEDSQTYFRDFPANFDFHEFAFYRTEIVSKKMFLFAHQGMVNVEIDTDTGKMERFPHLYDTEKVKGCKYSVVWKERDCIWILNNSEWIEWNVLTGEIKSVSYRLGEKIIRRYRNIEIKEKFEKYSKRNGYIVECEQYNLREYLQYATNCSD